VDTSWTVCELGCGPALPSLVLAGLGLPLVIATDLDELALDMVTKAAQEQGFDNLKTKCVDLTGNTDVLDQINADLYVMSDVFENGHVAKGAARMTMKALISGSRVWIFAQSDRAQREIFREELKNLGADKYGTIGWLMNESDNVELCSDQLLLFDLDEVTVNYG